MISVVIPAYNEEKYLAHCLNSLKEQNYSGEYEIIVVDNGSEDNTPQIAHELGARVISCARRGVVCAREAGFRASSGEIIVQADADSIYPSDWLLRIAEQFSSDPEVVAVAGDVRYQGTCPVWVKPLRFLRQLVNALSFRFSGKPASCLASAFAFRREALLKANGYNTALSFVGDERDLVARLSKAGKVLYDRHLLALTSSRRYSNGFWTFLADWLYNALFVPAWLKLSGKSLAHFRICPRKECARRHRLRLGRAGAICVFFAILGILSYGYFYPGSDMFGKVYAKAAPSEKAIALTFDDGPNEPYTSQILDILNSYGVKATFFAVGKNVEYYPEVAQRIVAEGHVLGNHTYTHKALTEFDPPDYSELDKTQKAIYEVTGVKPHLFRPPYGRKTPWELEYVKKKGMLTITWSDSAKDPPQPPSYIIEKRVLQRVRPGTIILLHDGNGTKHGADRSQTVAALPNIIESLQARGFTFVTVPELLQVLPYIK